MARSVSITEPRSVRYGWDAGGPVWDRLCARRAKEGAGRMFAMITSSGVYLILALIFLVIIGGGVIVAYYVSNRRDS